ncbi:MAG: hypothetical protein HY360_06545 [Verrucomicrobia bacterium]|nr:hypothetical protein [Verrucomicrobiota bacterium]
MQRRVERWQPVLDWNTPAGRLLDDLLRALPSESKPVITVFGSAPIQMGVDSGLLSADVDLFADQDLKEIVAQNSLGRDQRDIYIQVCDELNFRTSPKWRDRAFTIQRGGCTIRFPHPVDILIAKLHRLADKDLRAFEIVIQKTGHPTEAELIADLQDAVDLFRPGFDEENASDMIIATRRLWRHFFKRDIDPRVEIIAPALQRRRDGYGEPTRDFKRELLEIGSAYRVPRPDKRGKRPANVPS